MWPNVGHIRPNPAVRKTLDKMAQIGLNSKPNLAVTGPTSAESAKHVVEPGPMLAKVLPRSEGIARPQWVEPAQMLRNRTKCGLNRTLQVTFGQQLAEIGPRLDQLGKNVKNMVNIGRRSGRNGARFGQIDLSTSSRAEIG